MQRLRKWETTLPMSKLGSKWSKCSHQQQNVVHFQLASGSSFVIPSVNSDLAMKRQRPNLNSDRCSLFCQNFGETSWTLRLSFLELHSYTSDTTYTEKPWKSWRLSTKSLSEEEVVHARKTIQSHQSGMHRMLRSLFSELPSPTGWCDWSNLSEKLRVLK